MKTGQVHTNTQYGACDTCAVSFGTILLHTIS